MSSTNELTHIDQQGKVQMVDVSEKGNSKRIAKAECRMEMPDNILILFDGYDIAMPKGAVFQTAIIAGIMAAKKTSELIPLCHPIGLDDVKIKIELVQNEIVIESMATVHGKTGVEMEALTAASVAALTIYDMCKALSHHIIIKEIKLTEKTGGKHDFKRES